MQPIVTASLGCALCFLNLSLAGAAVAAGSAEPDSSPVVLPLATNIAQLRHLAQGERRVLCSLQLEGIVCAASSTAASLILQDNSGADVIEANISKVGKPLAPGDRIKIESAHCSVALDRVGLAIGIAPVVDNDGIHPMLRRKGDVFLRAGASPIRVLWFNSLAQLGLNVRFQGPGQKPQSIPNGALSRAEVDPATGRTNFVQGLDYRCYEGRWINLLSGFENSIAVKTGHATNFDISVRSRREHAGVEFTGFITVPQDGIYSFETESDDGSLLFVDEPPPQFLGLGERPPPVPGPLMAGQILDNGAEQWNEVEGTVAFASEKGLSLDLELRSETGRIEVVVANGTGLSPGLLLHQRVRVRGVSRAVQGLAGSRVFGLLSALSAPDIDLVKEPRRPPETLALLTSGDEVKRLKRAEAERGYPVKIRGVITRAVLPWNDTTVIQDSTSGIFVRGLPTPNPAAPKFGELWEIEGMTAPGDFAPVINWHQGRKLGPGRLPQPIAATWDQLMNGSLDTQYVEIQGVVTEAHPTRLQLLLPEGKVNLGFLDREPGTLERFQGDLIRVRGCLFPAWNRKTHRLLIGEMNIANASISVEEAVPADMFATPTKQIAGLLVYDPGAGALSRVKIVGQFLGARRGQDFLTDGTNGLRFETQRAANLAPGDIVEVVGFPKLGGSSPLLREAVVRKVGHAALPPPRLLKPENWLEAGNDSNLARVEGLLINRRIEHGEPVLELQSGARTIIGRLIKQEELSDGAREGSRLQLTGVYVAQGGNRALGQGIESFELLLNSSADVKVLAPAPWLTLPRVSAALGGVVAVLLVAMLWALSLRRQVNLQTAIIRQTAQREVALEERARIAKDIHDDLGASLTRIMLLALRVESDLSDQKQVGAHLKKIINFSRGTIQAMDEIVWAVNPRNDSLDGLVGYLNEYASQLFQDTDTRCRLRMPIASQLSLPAEIRHDLFLAFKEALNNVLKHSRASEVHVEVFHTDPDVRIIIDDNGCGFDLAQKQADGQGNGLQNMRRRMAALGGRMEITTTPGHGTKLEFIVRVPVQSSSNQRVA